MPIPASIAERVETFRRNRESCLATDHKETGLRREFLDPFFDALGWDVFNRQGHAEAHKDVVHEDMLKIGGQSTAPDYSFRIGGARKFFVEAKKPSVRIKDDPAPAAQLRRYSWTAKLPLGIVTDFQEFAIYDTRIRPRADDKASTGRVFYCTFEEFPQKWDEIAAIFSKDAVLKGSFDKYAVTNRGKRGTAEFDADFLADLESWRRLLAVNLAKRNTLDERELNFAVQRILDRIVFLRIAEDRGVEPLGQLQALVAGPRVYPRLREIFERADFRYNSGLFHFDTEKGRDEAPDRLTLDLELDDAVLKEILSALYWPKSPYAFAVVSADILGNVYEQFLGKVIRLDGPHRVKVEEKPEVRKAGGVYYTPAYIVDYIVRQAVGPLVAGKTPKQVEKLRVLDPACGSGSFLLGAYEFLLAWHLDYYAKNEPASWAKKKNPPIYETSPNAHGLGKGDGNWRLTTAERKRILVNNIFGVDIDAQAVEVTKLSLLLKVLEGEARELQGKQMDFHRVLPDLGNNIKCGNSLIGPDFYAQPDLPELDEAARYKINAFDWAEEFKPVFAQGGFDAVIGNPPYLAGREWERELHARRPYFSGNYTCFADQYDLYALFIQKSMELTADGGSYGAITPNTWLNNEHYLPLREWLTKTSSVVSLSDFRDVRVFKDATVLPVVFVARKAGEVDERSPVLVRKFHSPTRYDEHQSAVSVWREFPGLVFNLLLVERDVSLIKKIESGSQALGTLAAVRFGVKVYQKGKGRPKQTGAEASAKLFEADRKLSADYLPYLWGEHVSPWRIRKGDTWLKYGPHLAEPRTIDLFTGPRVLVRRIVGARLVLAPTEESLVADQLLHTVKPLADTTSHAYLSAILQSRLIAYYFRLRFNRTEKTFPEIRVAELAALRIRVIDPKCKHDRARHDQLVALVERMLKLHEDAAAAKSPDAQTRLQRDIKATDAAIDRLVYELYDLTPEEIALVEAATAPPVKPGSSGDGETAEAEAT